MGVPVVTVAGDRHASRVGASLLTAAGLGELVGGSVDEYITIAAGLAKDRDGLAFRRAGLRERVRSSSLCDGPGYARRWGEALRAVWERSEAR
jgi:predicted O-linked N-acetylglucosamine transferase (SPINDLY family)